MPFSTAVAALSIFASPKTMCGFFPPNSRITRDRLVDASSITCIPVSTDPVRAVSLTAGCLTRAPPTSFPPPVTTLTTPSGTPACLQSSANFSRVRGVKEAGLATTVSPAASAGAMLLAAMTSG